jgi:hypothetical protein
MSWESDDSEAYRSDDDVVGRSIRRGTRKGLGAAAGSALGGGLIAGPAGFLLGALAALLVDAAIEAPTAMDGSSENDE